jgi:hypothetical protein
MLERPPADEEVVVEYPIGEQTEDTPLSLLMQLEEDALSELSLSRVNEIIERSFLSADTLRMNGSVPPEIQNKIALSVFMNKLPRVTEYCSGGAFQSNSN